MASPQNLVITGIDRENKEQQFLLEMEPLNEGGEGIILRTVDKQYIIKIYKPNIQRKYDSMMEILQAGPKPSDVERDLLAWPSHLLVENKQVLGVVVPNATTKRWMDQLIWYTSPKLWQSVDASRRGNFLGFVKIARQITSALRFLNLTGYGHADLSGRNILCNPVDGVAVVIDLDGLVVPNHMTGDVIGTPGFIAPELVDGMLKRQYVLPSAISDRHALAVLLFQLLLWRHPLLGQHPPFDPDAQVDDLIATSSEYAVYVHHPHRNTNRPFDPHIPVEILGEEMMKLFERTFVQGIKSPQQRPHPSEWESALKRLQEDLIPCTNPKCPWAYFPSRQGEATHCPVCGTPSKPAAVAKLKIIKGKNGFYSKKKASELKLQREHILRRAQLFNSGVSKSQGELLEFSYQKNQWMLTLKDSNSDVSLWILNPHTGKRQKLHAGEIYPMTETSIAMLSLNDETCMLHLEK